MRLLASKSWPFVYLIDIYWEKIVILVQLLQLLLNSLMCRMPKLPEFVEITQTFPKCFLYFCDPLWCMKVQHICFVYIHGSMKDFKWLYGYLTEMHTDMVWKDVFLKCLILLFYNVAGETSVCTGTGWIMCRQGYS